MVAEKHPQSVRELATLVRRELKNVRIDHRLSFFFQLRHHRPIFLCQILVEFRVVEREIDPVSDQVLGNVSLPRQSGAPRVGFLGGSPPGSRIEGFLTIPYASLTLVRIAKPNSSSTLSA